MKRREFLKVLGVGTAATTMLGCASEKVEKLIPYLVSPDQTVPGVSTYYASTCRECSVACGVIAETRDGRTIIEVPLTLGVVGALLLPVWAAIAAIAAIVTDAVVTVEKRTDGGTS